MDPKRFATMFACLQAIRSRPPRPTPEELAAFERECREVDLMELGDVIMRRCPTPEHLEVAERIATTRIEDSVRGLES